MRNATLRVMKAGPNGGDKVIPVNLDNSESLNEANEAIAEIRRTGGMFFKAQPQGKDGEHLLNFYRAEDLKPGEEVIGTMPIIAG